MHNTLQMTNFRIKRKIDITNHQISSYILHDVNTFVDLYLLFLNPYLKHLQIVKLNLKIIILIDMIWFRKCIFAVVYVNVNQHRFGSEI